MVFPLSERSQFHLRRAGYGVAFRIHGWTECLVSLADERWLGRGVTDDDALDDALRQMLPSRLARELFHAQIASAPDEAASPEPPAASALPPLVEEATFAPVDLDPTAIPENEPVIEPVVEPVEEHPSAELTELPAPPAIEPLVAATMPSGKAVEPAPHDGPVEPDARAIALASSLAALDGMLRDIDAQLPKLAKKSAERQRFQLLGWICRARAFEEALPDARPVTIAVQRIARRLSEIGKMLWPGSVRALQLATTPADTMEPHAVDAPPETWAEAAERAELRHREHVRKATSTGFGEDGWLDAHGAGPAPADPDALLTQAVAELDALLGPAGHAMADDQDLTPIVRIAHTLRWVRESAQDHLAWGLAMGRLRRLAMSLGPPGALLRKTIDPTFRPLSSWAPVVATPTPSDAALHEESAAKLRTDLAELGTGEAALLPWLIRAFDIFPTPALADLLRSRRDQITPLAEVAATHDDRRIRRRLRDLIQRLASGGVDDTTPSSGHESTPSKDDEAEPESEDDSALRQLCDRVRPHTEGRRVLFASNRTDARLEARLTDLLGVRMAGCDGTPRRVQSQCERIAQGSYDLVLSATGFQDHAVDGALAHAASFAGIPYVRVNRGRPLACAQAIARELGEAGVSPGKASNRAAVRAG